MRVLDGPLSKVSKSTALLPRPASAMQAARTGMNTPVANRHESDYNSVKNASQASLASAKQVSRGGNLITRIGQLEMRMDCLLIDCDNYCLTRGVSVGERSGIRRKIEHQLKTLSELGRTVESGGVLACGSATQTYQCQQKIEWMVNQLGMALDKLGAP